MSVVDVHIHGSESYAGGREFGSSGAYERIDGVLTFAVDPEHAVNRDIVDIELAPRDDDGRVRFRSDFTLLTPSDPAKGNRRLIVDVVNRGRRRVVSLFNRVPAVPASAEIPAGDGFLFRHGYSVVSIGWQWDVRRSDALLGLEAPRAEIDGHPVRGQAVVEIRPDVEQRTRLLANRTHETYPAADLDDPDATLLVRDWEDDEDTEIPRDEWRFARESDGDIVPSRDHVYLESGFQPGKIYYAVYTTEGAPIVGAGLLAVREVASFLRHPSALNPVANGFERVFGFGVSQTGRLLRHMAYLGLNLDEDGRRAFDGLLPHIAGGRRGEFNHRFAQPSAQSVPGFGHRFPFADEEMPDPYSEAPDGVLRRLRELNATPRIIYTNTSAEYWRGDGSLVHIDPSGQSDLEPAPETRIYHFAGTQHGPGTLPQQRESDEGARGRYPFNTVDYRPLLRAALVNLDRWVSEGVEPPPNRHPRLDDGTATTRRALIASFDVVPGLVKPDPDRLWVVRTVDLGPEEESGVGRYPALEGKTYPAFVASLDADGNERAGIRLPDLTVPAGTHAGWNLRDPETGAPEQQMSMRGFTNFFAPTRAAREAASDARPSIEERYDSRDDYLRQVREQAQGLVDERYALAEDIDLIVEAAAERYDAAVRAGAPEAAPVG